MVNSYIADIWHVVDKDNPLADGLSWAQINAVHPGVAYAAIVDQLKGAEVQALRTAAPGLQLQDVASQAGVDMLLCDVSTVLTHLLI